LEEGYQKGNFRFSGEIEAMASLIFSLLQGGLFLARVRGGVTQLQKVTAQLMLLVQG
jgi:TetR/AcrR family transcriptional regulator, transcriptional repressor for nem operon